MRNCIVIVFLVCLLFLSPSNVFAQSDYVLPYPSSMPGSKYYQLEVLIQDKIMPYWYFGNLGQFTYQLKQADKYLVEAKTLFEYKQYLLAYHALKKSDAYFQRIPGTLQAAEKEGKEIDAYHTRFKGAASKHTEVLTDLIDEIPEEFVWSPEKSAPTRLPLKEAIEQSITTRKGI